MAVAWPALGTTFAIDEAGTGSNGNGTYTLISNIVSLTNIGGGEVGERDTTVLTSTAKTFAPTIADNQDATVELLFDPTDAAHKFIRNAKDLGGTNTTNLWYYFKATPNLNANTNTVVFQAFIKTFDGYNFDDVDSNLTATVTLRKTGAVVWT